MNQRTENSNQQPRAVMYCRVARLEPGSVAIEQQRQACEDIARSQGLKLVGNYEDVGQSGATIARPGLLALLTRITADQDVDWVVAVDGARLTRKLGDGATLAAVFRQAGVGLATTRRDLEAEVLESA